jgi:hypothetical protein
MVANRSPTQDIEQGHFLVSLRTAAYCSTKDDGLFISGGKSVPDNSAY